MAAVEVRVLGFPQVVVDGVVVALTGRQLLLACRLAMAHPSPVSRRRLLADVWPDETAGDGAVRVALTRLRNALGADVVLRIDGGYALSSPTSVDAARFCEVLGAGSGHDDPEERLATIDEAMALWRGAAFEGIERTPWVDGEAVYLDELREQAIDERFAALIRTRHPSAVIAELRSAFGRDPTRERRAELLATALYRVGRQADALATIRRTRSVLRERLGLDPGPALRDLEVRILRHDARLDRPGAASPDPPAADVVSSLRSAATLTRLGAYTEAHTILEAATTASRHSLDRRLLARALLATARTSLSSGAMDPHPLIDEARQIGRDLRDGRLLAQCAIVRFGSGVPTEKSGALVELVEPLELLPPSAPEQVDLLCIAAAVVALVDASDGAHRLVAAAERLHTTAPTMRSEVACLTVRSIVGSVHGAERAQLDEWSGRALEVARATGEAALVVVAIQARLCTLYAAGDLDAVDELLEELHGASQTAALPFGVVRVTLCQATNALARGDLDAVPGLIDASRDLGARLRTFAAERSAAAQEALLLRELDRHEELVELARRRATRSPANMWHAILAACGDVERPLLDLAPLVPADDLFPVFVALAADVAARRGDAPLGKWCVHHLERRDAATIMSGLGTLVIGSTSFFTGLGRVAIGDLDAAAADFERSAREATVNGAHLWRDHAEVELADVLRRLDREADRGRAATLVDGLRAGGARSPRLARRCHEVSAAMGHPVVAAHLARA